MKNLFCKATLVASVISLAATSLNAQTQRFPNQRPAAQRPSTQRPTGQPMAAAGNVRLVDIGLVMKNYSRFTQLKDQFGKEASAAQTEIQTKLKAIQTEGKQLAQFKAGSPEFKKLQIKLAKDQADLAFEKKLREKTLAEREALFFVTIYQDIQLAIKNYSERRGINLVLVHNSAPIKKDSPRAVQEALMRPVVYQANLDITQDIIRALGSKTARPAASVGRRPPAGSVPRRRTN